MAEIDRVLGRPGHPRRDDRLLPERHAWRSSREDDAVWARVVEAGVPLDIHVSLTQHMPAAHRAALPGYGRFFDAPNRIVQLILAGVFDRFPELDVVFAEVDCGWVPYFKEQIDNNYRRLDPISGFRITGAARASTSTGTSTSRYMTDPFGFANRGHDRRRAHPLVERLPAHLSDWPYSWEAIEKTFAGVAADERDAILHGNAQRLYGFGR